MASHKGTWGGSHHKKKTQIITQMHLEKGRREGRKALQRITTVGRGREREAGQPSSPSIVSVQQIDVIFPSLVYH